MLSLLGLQIVNFPSDRFNKTARQFASLVETTKITGKITVRAMTVAPGEIKVQTSSTPKKKVETSTHSMNDVITFYVLHTPFQSSASITQKAYIFYSFLIH